MEKHLKNWFLLILSLQSTTASMVHDDYYCQLILCFKARAFELIQPWLLKWPINYLSKLKDKNVSKSANRFDFGYLFNMFSVTWFGFTQWSVNGVGNYTDVSIWSWQQWVNMHVLPVFQYFSLVFIRLFHYPFKKFFFVNFTGSYRIIWDRNKE